MVENYKGHEHTDNISDDNPIRNQIKKKGSTDFSSSSFRRIALTQLGRHNR
ncbi:hypothetical protein ACLM5H_10365 [Fredinandcohnia humi]